VSNQQVFCNTPWYELHIYWDGSLGICCQEAHKLYKETDQQYNISKMTIADWFNSEPVRNFRQGILGDQRRSECTRCYLEENHGGHSRRLNSNQKSVIFTRTAFDESFKQSPGFKHFLLSADQGYTDTHPIDLHIDLGNFCNLACKMCNAQASSTIASQEVKWGIESSRLFLGTNWTKDRTVWDNFKQQLLKIPNLNNIHFMGGETLLTDQFEDFVDTMLEHNRTDLCFSFVTNGTTFRPALLDKLKRFRRVGLEISIEATTAHNTYVRQGTDTELVVTNIHRYLTWCNNTSITVALRPAPSLLTIGYYVSLLEFALEHKLVVKSNLCYDPRFLNAEMLPDKTKLLYRQYYLEFLKKLPAVSVDTDYNASDPNNYLLIIKEEVDMCLAILQTPKPHDHDIQLKQLIKHCKKWDNIYGYNARALYPELTEIFDYYDY
jgi:hypothetical protein